MSVDERRRSLVFPREHGAWGILLVPLATGAATGLVDGGSLLPLIPLTVAALALFLLRTPVESWIGTTPLRTRSKTELQSVRTAVLVFSVVSVAALVVLLWGGRNTGLFWIGVAAAAAFAGQAILKRVSRGARIAAQIIGAAGLTATAPAAYYVATGDLNRTALSLWAANLAFAANQIQFVQLRIRAAHAASRKEKLLEGRWFLVGQVVLIALVAAAAIRCPSNAYAAMAFLPILLRGFAWFAAKPEPLRIRALGIGELVHNCAFGVLLVLGLTLAGGRTVVRSNRAGGADANDDRAVSFYGHLRPDLARLSGRTIR